MRIAIALLLLSQIADAQSDVSLADGFEFPPPSAYRYSDLDLRDPHVFISTGPFCSDFTDNPIPFTTFSFNGSIADSFVQDTNPADGILDASSMLFFRPLRLDGGIARVDSGGASCTAPAPPASCTPGGQVPTAFNYATQSAGTCLGAIPGTIGSPAYSPAIAAPVAPCFVTNERTLTIDSNGTPITLRRAQIAAAVVGTGTQLTQGLLRGFISEADANAVLINNPLVPGQTFTLSSLLPGGVGNCSSRNDKDTVDGVSGWWFYLNFNAAPAPYTGP